MKKLILVTSPPACGKTFVSKEISKALDEVVYLDKDTLIPLSKQVFAVANQDYNRSSEFFETNIRNYEYEVIVDLALESLDYASKVLINAPFTREIRDMKFMDKLRKQLAEKGAELVLIWVQTDPKVCHERMIKRNSDRDTWKLRNWDEYVSKIDFSAPIDIPELYIFKNSSEEEFKQSIVNTVEYLNR